MSTDKVIRPRADSVRDRGPVGVIGCGGVTRATIAAFLDAGGRVAWVADPDPHGRNAVANLVERHQERPRQFDDLESALAIGTDGAPVMVNSPAALHLGHIEACAAAGRPMLVAKPLAGDWDEVRRALDAADAAGVSIEIAEQYPDEAHARQMRGLIDEYGPAQRILLDHRKPASGQTMLSGKAQTGILEYAVHHYAVLGAWLDRLPATIAVDSWTSDGGKSGEGSIGHSWIRYDDCHVLHAFGFGGARATYRAELDLEHAAVVAEGTHFSAPDVTLRVTQGAHVLSVPQRAGAGDPWARVFGRWLDTPADRGQAGRRRQMLIAAAMVDAALRAATSGAVVRLSADDRYAGLA